MVTSQQNVPRIVFMQISAAIIEKKNVFTISQPVLQITDKIRCIDHVMRVSEHNKVIVDMITHVFDSLICKLVPPLSKNQLFTISRPILLITAKTRCPDPCVQGQR